MFSIPIKELWMFFNSYSGVEGKRKRRSSGGCTLTAQHVWVECTFSLQHLPITVPPNN